MALYQDLGDEIGTAWALALLGGYALSFPDEVKEGITLCEEGLALFRKAGHKPGIMQALTIQGELRRLEGTYDLAQKAYIECLALSRQTGYKLREAITLANLSSVAQHEAQPEQAVTYCSECLTILRELGDNKYSAMLLAKMAGTLTAVGHPLAAARLLGASEALLEVLGITQHAGDWSDLNRDLAKLRKQLDDSTFETAWAEGKAMSLEQAISYALEIGKSEPGRSPVDHPEDEEGGYDTNEHGN